MKFAKMHGLGNDFILIEDMKDNIHLTSENIINLCDRHFGIGADGLMLIKPSKIHDIKMAFYNQDGTEASMCGNGVRCFAKYVYQKGIVKKAEFDIESIAGKISPKIMDNSVQVNMGKAIFTTKSIPVNIDKNQVLDEKLYINGKEIVFSSVFVGVPHTIIEVEDIQQCPVQEWGPLIEKHILFPSKTNVNFVEIINPKEVKVITWERGAGLTLACGTGACAVVSILREKKKVQDQVLAHLPGGLLNINIIEDGSIFMTGPVQEVFTGNFDT